MDGYEETKRAVNEVLHETNDQGETIIGKEVNRHIDKKFNQLWKWLVGGGFAIVVMGTAGWVNQNNEIDRIEDFVSEGGRYTQEEQNVYSAEVDRRFLEQDAKYREILEDLRIIRQATVGY